MSAVLVETVSRTRIVALNRPEARNALTRAVTTGIHNALAAAAADDDVRCIILTGIGGHFCSGADLRKNLADDPLLFDHLEEYLDEYHAVIRAIVRSPKPTIAMLDGCAVGFGADLALACDLRIATPSAYVQEKFVKIGLMPDGGGTFWLPRLVGTARAMRALLFAEKLGAADLDALGLVLKIVSTAELRDATLAVAREIEDGPPLAHAEIKRAVVESWGDFEAALQRERAGQLALLRSQDAVEGIRAWMEKRPPRFLGR